jgi:hypothetical protein
MYTAWLRYAASYDPAYCHCSGASNCTENEGPQLASYIISVCMYGFTSFPFVSLSFIMCLICIRGVRILKKFLDSCRFLDRLEASLLLKKQNELKLVESSRDLSQKRVTLRNSLTLLWPKQEAAVTRLREVKQNTEKTISSLYDGRPVNIIGDINTMLGPL